MKNASNEFFDAFLYFFDVFFPPFHRNFVVILQQFQITN